MRRASSEHSICVPQLRYIWWHPRTSPFPTCLGKSHFNFSLHFSISECYLPRKIAFSDCLDQQRISVVPAPLSTRSPGRTAAKLNLAFGNEFIHLIHMQLRQTNPNFKGKWVLIFLKRVNMEQPDPWETPRDWSCSSLNPPGFYNGKATQSGRDLTVLSIKDAANLTHSDWLAQGTYFRNIKKRKKLLKISSSAGSLSLFWASIYLFVNEDDFKPNHLQPWLWNFSVHWNYQ